MSRHSVSRKFSPDRTYNEEVEDSQNSFRWAARHTFRPHQHYTYDPSSWSRKLDEITKKAKRLTFVERLEALRQRDAERGKSCATRTEEETVDDTFTTTEASDDTPDYFYTAEETESCKVDKNSHTCVPLQEMLDEMQRLRRILKMSRFTGNASLTLRERQTRQYEELLVAVLMRLDQAIVSEHLTQDAVVYTFFLLMERVADTLQALTHIPLQRDSPSPLCEAAAIQWFFNTLDRMLLLPLCRGEFAVDELGLEALTEVMYLVAHPFTRQCTLSLVDEQRSSTLQEICVRVAGHVQAALLGRLADASEHTPRQAERVLPLHLCALAAGLRWISDITDVTSAALCCANALRWDLQYLLGLLRGVTAPTARHAVRATLLASSFPRGSPSGAPKPVSLDATNAPSGLQVPLTEADDVYYCLRACTDLLHVGIRVPSHRTLDTLIDDLMAVMSHSPNYDLNATLVVQFSLKLIECGVVQYWSEMAASDDRKRSLQWVLLLSRLTLVSVGESEVLAQLLLSLCAIPLPAYTDARTLNEWRRLRGLTMQRLLERLRVEDLVRATTSGLTWEECLAHQNFEGLVPMRLWYDACAHRLTGSEVADVVSAGTAAALIQLRGRLCVEKRASRRVPVDGLSWGYVASCVEVLSAGRVLKTALLQDVKEWDEASTYIRGSDEALQLLADCKEHCRERCDSMSKVVAFY